MADDWLTYEQAAERLGVTPEAVRQKAIRGRWQRSRGNDGKARVRLPEGSTDAVRTPSKRPNANPVRTPSERVSAERLFKALEDHVETLKRDLAARESALEAVRNEITAERDTNRAKIAALEESLGAERQRAEEAIKAHLNLAERVAAEKARPWWKRLAG
jgi:hypothetical protein